MSFSNLPRSEYPRPQFERSAWLNLNGEWEFDFDDAGIGDSERWYAGHSFSRTITVPFAFQSKLSGIGDPSFHDTVWYRKEISIPGEFAGKRVILRFGAVDYEATVWVNGRFAVRHEGGHTPFSVDITDYIDNTTAVIVVKAQDFGKELTLPRGKQFWEEKSRAIWYTRTTGIWQTVWLEAVAETHLDRVCFTPDIDTNEIAVRAWMNGLVGPGVQLRSSISFQGDLIAEETRTVLHPETAFRVGLNDFNDHGLGRWWSPDRPNLYDVTFTVLVDGRETDQVRSYFGMRKISIENGRVCLNNRPYFMKLVLDQGYFPDGVLTAPSDDAIRADVELTKEMGFDGARKHQKIEDPRYLYWCDKLGLLVWGEMANALAYSETYVRRITSEWQEAIERDYNHPCIVAWVPLNESWGYSAAKDEEDFIERYRAVTEPLLQSPVVQGFCYTQLTDVEQEINGLLTYDRQPKVPLEQIKAINQGKMIPR
jgi:beta-galactosidase/beta-glucuronidase